jgi:RNA polymerase sigma factor (sigma-70 family)
MSQLTQAEAVLLEQIRKGDSQAWSQLVERYQGRLCAYAQKQLPSSNDADDLVQETFVNFIRSLGAFRGDCSVESWLFTILRRKIIEVYRRNRSRRVALIHDLASDAAFEETSDYSNEMTSSEPTASWYVRRDERREQIALAVAGPLLAVLDALKASLNFDHIKVIELLFYCQLSNTRAAEVLGLDPARVGVIKHRCLREIRERLAESPLPEPADGDFEGILTRLWQDFRPSCPKRSTIGAWMLGTLEEDWRAYVDFHLNTVGCRFCRANLDDLRRQNEEKGSKTIRNRILESTVGFLKK